MAGLGRVYRDCASPYFEGSLRGIGDAIRVVALGMAWGSAGLSTNGENRGAVPNPPIRPTRCYKSKRCGHDKISKHKTWSAMRDVRYFQVKHPKGRLGGNLLNSIRMAEHRLPWQENTLSTLITLTLERMPEASARYRTGGIAVSSGRC